MSLQTRPVEGVGEYLPGEREKEREQGREICLVYIRPKRLSAGTLAEREKEMFGLQ